MKNQSFIITLSILIATSLVAALLYVAIRESVITSAPVFFKRNMVESLWFHYKKDYLEPTTLRALDKQRDNITTSEGQSYTMLRAVWMDDKETFDTTWQWTKDNLQREDDHLFHWLFGQRADGSYGILTDQGGENTATDADVDIAIALLFASERWNSNEYFGDAIEIVRDIWANEVVMIGGKPYLVANNIEKFDTTKASYVINPSYYAPYAYRIFEEIDGDHDWIGVVDTSYEIIEKNLQSPLNTGSTAHIPSDWLLLNKKTAGISAHQSKDLTTNFSYDALRLPWRLALDVMWFDEVRAKDALKDMAFLKNEWANKGLLHNNYRHNGEVIEQTESGAFYGGTIGYFKIAEPELVEEIYLRKLEGLYNPDTFNWKTNLSYYDSNWAWFGIALYNDLLPQLFMTSDQTTP